jgi:predicted transcriptional regulator
MLPTSGKEIILGLVRDHPTATNQTFANVSGFSMVTVNTCLSALEAEGIIDRQRVAAGQG